MEEGIEVEGNDTGKRQEPSQPPAVRPFIQGQVEPDRNHTYNILGRWYAEADVEQVHRQNAERQAAYLRQAKAEWSVTPQGKLCLELYDKFCAYKKYLDEHPWARKRRDGAKVDFPEHVLFEDALCTVTEYQHCRAEKDRQNLEKAQLAARCEHAYLDGDRCRAPRVKGKKLCHMHERMEEAKAVKLDLGPLEDPDSIQVAIVRLQRTVIEGTLDAKQIGQLSYLIQLASCNVTRMTSANRELPDAEIE